MREKRNVLTFSQTGKLRAGECRACGAAVRRGAGFCASCGFAQADVTPSLILRSRPGMVRRVLAEIIDRLMPLPFLAYLFPLWVWVVVAYHLICDGSPSGQSVGKWVCRLCVVSTATGEPCGVWRAVLRRLPTALGQAAYCAWMMIPVVIAYELVMVAFVWLNPTGRRLEDYLTGTQVITRSAYLRRHRNCAWCGERVAAGVRYCPHCGQTVEDQECGG
ncbi:MAG TPA: RDD family protein [Blastocatellia bacterium]|nr:RDD family protein [Blastocatellia bacterium]